MKMKHHALHFQKVPFRLSVLYKWSVISPDLIFLAIQRLMQVCCHDWPSFFCIHSLICYASCYLFLTCTGNPSPHFQQIPFLVEDFRFVKVCLLEAKVSGRSSRFFRRCPIHLSGSRLVALWLGMYIFVASETSTYIRLNNDLNMLCCVLGRFTGPVTSLRASRGAQHLGPGSTLMAKNV